MATVKHKNKEFMYHMYIQPKKQGLQLTVRPKEKRVEINKKFESNASRLQKNLQEP